MTDVEARCGVTNVDNRSEDAALYASLAPELIRFASGLVGPSDAADVMSSAIVKSLSTPTWPEVGNKRAYLYRAVFNESNTWLRRSSQRRVHEAATALGPHWDLPNLRPEVREAVLSLSVRQRAVVLLTYWLDLTPTEVAERLGVSDGAVRRHLARAREHLRGTLDV